MQWRKGTIALYHTELDLFILSCSEKLSKVFFLMMRVFMLAYRGDLPTLGTMAVLSGPDNSHECDIKALLNGHDERTLLIDRFVQIQITEACYQN